MEERVAAAATPDIIEAYQRDGAVCLRGLLNREELATLTRGIDANLASPSPRSIVASRSDDPGFFIEDFCNWQHNPDYRSIACSPYLAHVAGKLMKSRTVRLYHDHMLTKQPSTTTRTPWHQDQPYYNIDGFQNVSFWIPVDPVPRESSLEMVAGSHRGPWMMPRTFMDNQAKWFPEGSLAELPDIEASRGSFPIVSWALQPGDVVAFHMLTLHAAAGAQQRRRVFSVRYAGDDVTHAPRRWKTSPDFPGLADQLPAGARLDHPLFPMLVGGGDS